MVICRFEVSESNASIKASCCYHPSTVGAVQDGVKQTGLVDSYDQGKTKLLIRKHILLLTPPWQQPVHYKFRANTSVGVNPETFLILQQDSTRKTTK
jgi:hypothetical protein